MKETDVVGSVQVGGNKQTEFGGAVGLSVEEAAADQKRQLVDSLKKELRALQSELDAQTGGAQGDKESLLEKINKKYEVLETYGVTREDVDGVIMEDIKKAA